MIKRLAIIVLLATPAVYADWMDDLSQFVDVKERTLDYLLAETAVQKLLDEDNEALAKHAQETENTDNSFWGNVTGYLNVAKWGTTKVDSMKLQKVLDYIKELPNNQEAHDSLVSDLSHILNRKQELELLQDEFEGAQGWKEKVTLRGYLVAKNTQIAARKKLIEKRIFIA